VLTTIERRFIRHWQEQREGGKLSYIILYSIVGTFISTLILSVFLVLFFQIVFGTFPFWIVVLSGFLISFLASWVTWNRNEQKLQRIIRREVEADGERADPESEPKLPG
jgi:high-affinity Fe2+/Pb2+ permease